MARLAARALDGRPPAAVDGSSRTPWRNVLTALVAVLLTLGAVELYYRATYRAEWLSEPEFPPGQYPKLNAVGLRDVDYGPKQPGTYRILLLGDSFTFGSGVVEDDAIWPAIIERRLNEMRPLPGVTRYEVLNGGVAGSLTDTWLGVFEQQWPLFQPDLVLAVFFLRDGTRLEPVQERLANENLSKIRADPLAAVSTAWRYHRERWLARNFASLLERFFVDSYVGTSSQTAEWQQAQRNLMALRGATVSGGAAFGVVIFPMLYGFDRDPYPFQPAMDAVEAFCRTNGIPSLDLLPAYAGRRASTLWVSEVNKHPNAAGHVVAANAMIPFLTHLMRSNRR